MATGEDGHRAQGVEFGSFGDEIAEFEYPVTSVELIERYGEHELDHVNGSERVADVLDRLEATFESPREVRAAVVGSMGMDAVGRKRYTDRGGNPPEEHDMAPTETL